MSDSEFWSSTLVKVMALVNMQDERDKIRDYFPALIASHVLNYLSDGSQITADDILDRHYKKKGVVNTQTVDPDRGAPGLEWAREKWMANHG